MSGSVFVRVHDAAPNQKCLALRGRLAVIRSGHPDPDVFLADTSCFTAIPGCPFAYWVSDTVRKSFSEHRPLATTGRLALGGLKTQSDERFVRATWEVSTSDEVWVPFVKGGSRFRYYSDVHLRVNWTREGEEISWYGYQKRPREGFGGASRGRDAYFRPGLTWSSRADGLGFRVLPAGCVFSHKGPSLFVDGDSTHELLRLLAILNSPSVATLVRALSARTELAQSYEVGLVSAVPVPPLGDSALADHANALYTLARRVTVGDETTIAFVVPTLLVHDRSRDCLERAYAEAEHADTERRRDMDVLERDISARVRDLYGFGLPGESLSATPPPTSRTDADDSSSSAAVIADRPEGEETDFADCPSAVANVMLWALGCTFGRWDARMALDPTLVPGRQAPFARLPAVAPGSLVGPDGRFATYGAIASSAWLRARPNVITLPPDDSFTGPASITAAEYPIPVAWDGILVDDEGHPHDIVAAVRRVLTYVYGDRAPAVEDEALALLRGDGVQPKTLRDWFRNAKAVALGKTFFDFHIQRYTKSRRKAPIYWRLASSPNAPYAVWLYYPRLTPDTLWRVLGDYVTPRRQLAERQLAELRSRREKTAGAERRKLEREVEATAALLDSVSVLEQELRRVAERGYAPDLDDGVVVSAAPLHRVIPWGEPAKVWKELEAGKYDWAKLAMALWPERVRAKCATDKSLAIAHGLA